MNNNKYLKLVPAGSHKHPTSFPFSVHLKKMGKPSHVEINPPRSSKFQSWIDIYFITYFYTFLFFLRRPGEKVGPGKDN